jgi:ABC-2 type transport system permease protein
MGTLEALLATPNRISFIIVSSSLWNFIWASISVLVYLGLGSLFFDFEYRLNLSSLFSGFLILILSIVIFSSIGIISAGFVIIFKRGIPFTWAIGMTSGLLGGVYYPIEVMPQFLRLASNFIPLRYSLGALRKILLAGLSFREVYPEILTLLLFVLVLLPLALFFFNFAVRKAKMDGSLVFY